MDTLEPARLVNTDDSALLSRILPGFDQETLDFYRWRVAYTPEELADVIRSKLALDLGPIHDLQALARGAYGRICRLKIGGPR
jgi:stage II sporulation protein D